MHRVQVSRVDVCLKSMKFPTLKSVSYTTASSRIVLFGSFGASVWTTTAFTRLVRLRHALSE